MKKLYIPILIFIGIGINVNAQELATKNFNNSIDKPINSVIQVKSKDEIKGDKLSFEYSYDKAIESYNNSEKLTTEGQRKLAEIYRKLDMYVKSEEAYSNLIIADIDILPVDYYNYAMILKINGKYDESNKWMDKFKYLNPDDLRVKDYNTNKNNLSDLLLDDGKYKIGILDVNTNADDFGPCYYKNGIVFSSSRSSSRMIVRKDNWSGKPFLDMYISEVNEGQLEKPKKFNKSMNGKMNDGPVSFGNDGAFMAFTRNNYDLKRKDSIVKLEIYFSNYKDGNWSEPESFILNNKDYSVGNPCLTSDGKTMYFTSDMPGGFGKTDIYRINKNEKGEWGKSENLGDKINTEGDEMFPFFEENNEVLFFTSNGRFGLGGFDVFICPLNGSEVGRVYNAGAPLNTQFDDFAVIVDAKMNKGYFSSNRINGSGGDDIYSFDLLKLEIGKKIIGIALDKTGNHIPKTFISLLDDKNQIIDTITTQDDGNYSFLVDSDKNFKLNGQKDTYTEGDTVANTFGKEFIVKADVVLIKNEEIVEQKIVEQKITVKSELTKNLILNSVYFDLDKYNVRPDAAAELDKIVKIMNENSSMIVELGSYTDCRESVEYNQILSDKRAKASTDYIKKRITNSSRITGKGYSKSNLVNGCSCDDNIGADCTEAEHQQNRRTEFNIIKK